MRVENCAERADNTIWGSIDEVDHQRADRDGIVLLLCERISTAGIFRPASTASRLRFIRISGVSCILGTRGNDGMSHKSMEVNSTFKGGPTEIISTTGLPTRRDCACTMCGLRPDRVPRNIAIDLPW